MIRGQTDTMNFFQIDVKVDNFNYVNKRKTTVLAETADFYDQSKALNNCQNNLNNQQIEQDQYFQKNFLTKIKPMVLAFIKSDDDDKKIKRLDRF